MTLIALCSMVAAICSGITLAVIIDRLPTTRAPRQVLPEHPGIILARLATINGVMRGMSTIDIMSALELTPNGLRDFILGKMSVSPALARRLETLTGTSAETWLEWDRKYYTHLHHLTRKDAS